MEAQEVVPVQTGTGSWSVEVEASMWAEEVVVMEPEIELLYKRPVLAVCTG